MASDVLYLSLSNGTYLGSIGISGGHADSVRETECASFVC